MRIIWAALTALAIGGSALAQVAAPPVAPPLTPENTLVLDLSTGGRVTIAMRPDVAPKHVERIKTLVRQHFYDGTIFHRVIDGFMAQGGDPTGTGTGGSKLPNLKPEFSDLPHVRGAVAMARAGEVDSANSQFYIVPRAVAEARPQLYRVGPRRQRHGVCRRDREGRAAGQPVEDRPGVDRCRQRGAARGRCGSAGERSRRAGDDGAGAGGDAGGAAIPLIPN